MKISGSNVLIGLCIGIVLTAAAAYSLWPKETVLENANQNAALNANQTVDTSNENVAFVLQKKADKNQIVLPHANAVISSPVAIAGNALVFENQAMLSLYDASGNEIEQVAVSVHAADIGEYGPFLTLMDFTAPASSTGTLQLWDTAAKDGAKMVLDEVTVRFR